MVEDGYSAAPPVWPVTVEGNDVSQWFGEYLDAFAACSRGASDTGSLLGYYGVPLLVTTDSGSFSLMSGERVVATPQQQVDELRAAGYGRSEILDSDVTVLNSASGLSAARYRGSGTTAPRSAG